MAGSGYPLVWVESPLQFVSAAELAAQRGARLRVAFRLGAQMSQTAAELLSRGAGFASCTPYFGIPWGELHGAPEWIVGDGLSGQFRLAAAVLRPRTVTLLDDGTMSLRLAAALAGSEPFERVAQNSSGMRALLGGLARDHLLRLAGTDRLEFFTMYGPQNPEFSAAAALGVRLRGHSFSWTRRTARPPRLPGDRVLLGTARVTDGSLDAETHLAEVSRIAAASVELTSVPTGATGPLVYLPHRRESPAHVDAVRGIAGVAVVESGLPVELFLAGAEGLEILSVGSTADLTLDRVLARRERAA